MHIVYTLRPGGGPETFLQTLQPWMEQAGHRLSVIYTNFPTPRPALFRPSVTVRYAPPGSLHYYLNRVVRGARGWPIRMRAWEESQAVGAALRALDAVAPVDLVEVSGPLPGLRGRWPVVLRSHGNAWTFRHFCGDAGAHRDSGLIQMEAAAYRRVAGVAAISSHLADYLSGACRFPRARIAVQPYPIDTARFAPRPATAPAPARPALMAIGRLERRKGTDVLLQAMARVWQQFPDVDVYLPGGEGDFTRADLLALVPPAQRPRVIFPGFLAHSALPDLYRAMRLYVAPTQYETFGYTVLEAMACGLPVVASQVGAVPELVADGRTGTLVPFRDAEALAAAIRALLADPARAAALGQAGRQKALSYQLDMVGPTLESFYRQLVQKRPA